MKKDDLGNRMKMYEGIEAARRLIPRLPICVRIDGRAFHTFTKGLKRPYDERLMHCMLETTRFLVKEANASVGYTQSDEINLVLFSDDLKSQPLFDGRVQKLVSVLASAATMKFCRLLMEHLPEKADKTVMFDARVWSVPSLEEAANVLVWRELDATRNSIQSAAGAYYSHKQLHKKNTSEMQELLFQKGINWNDYPAKFKRGSYFQRRKVQRTLTAEEIERIPRSHRPEPGQVVERTEILPLELPPLRKVKNRVDVLFFGATPERYEEG